MLKRSRQSSPVCTYPGRCHSSITRFVWDGNQILWEVRQADGYNKDIQDPSGGSQSGNIGYVHAGGIDAPLGMVRNGSTVVLHRNWRGLYAFATDENGDQLTCAPQSFSGCDDVSWPGGTWNLQRGHIDPHGTQTWYGSVSMGQQDRTGLLYQRNRYYDSSTGQFTRQDPIGIAGGLNLYGYANGDPVNFHDPFGLVCEEVDEPIPTHPTTTECEDERGDIRVLTDDDLPASGVMESPGLLDPVAFLAGGIGAGFKKFLGRAPGSITNWLARETDGAVLPVGPNAAGGMQPRTLSGRFTFNDANSPRNILSRLIDRFDTTTFGAEFGIGLSSGPGNMPITPAGSLDAKLGRFMGRTVGYFIRQGGS